MVYFKMRLVIFLFFSSLTAYGGIALEWKDTKNTECQKLVSTMLEEMRAMTNDQLIEINSREPEAGATKITVQCQSPSGESKYLELTGSDETFKLHYLGKTAGFDSLDWVPIQKKFFSSTPVAEKTEQQVIENFPRSEPELSAIAKTESISVKSHKRLWFGAAAGGAAGAMGGAFFSPNVESRPLNILVFGLVGAVAGALTGAISDNNANTK